MPFSHFDPELVIFDCGQGTANYIRYSQEAIIFDAGTRKETAGYSYKPIGALHKNIKRPGTFYAGPWRVSPISLGHSNVLEFSKTEPVDFDTRKQAFLTDVTADHTRVRAVFISRPEEESFNFVYPSEQFHPDAYVLGSPWPGFHHDFRSAICSQLTQDKVKVIVTANQPVSSQILTAEPIGSFNRMTPTGCNGSFQSYQVFGKNTEDLPDHHKYLTFKGTHSPKVEILSMGKASGSSGNSKDGSLVLKISGVEHSVLLPSSTPAEQLIQLPADKLKSSILVLPSVGEDRSVSRKLLRMVQPVACIIAGGSLSQISGRTIDTLLTYYSEDTDHTTASHYVTHGCRYGGVTTALTTAPVFTTADHGTMRVNLKKFRILDNAREHIPIDVDWYMADED